MTTHQYTCRRLAVAAALLTLAACSRQLEGPTPKVTAVTPGAVCHAQLDTTVTIQGEGLSPLLTGHLEGQRLEIPAVTLSRVQDAAGGTASGQVVLPDDAAAPGESRVRWLSQEQMAFEVTPDLDLEPGLYDVQVQNRNGRSVNFAGGLLAVPPPTLASVEPDLLCGAKQNRWALDGDFFIRSPDAQPIIHVGAQTFAPTEMEGCRALPGTAGLQACTRLILEVGAEGIPAGNHAVRVENPEPVGCGSTEARDLTVVPAPAVVAVAPDAVCVEQDAVQLTLTGENFLRIAGAEPTVSVGAVILTSVTSNCTPVEGPEADVQSCTTLTVTVPQGTAPGPYQVTVQNPAPADCSSGPGPQLTLFGAPQIASIAPAAICSQSESQTLVVTGSGFTTVEGAAPAITVGSGSGTEYASTPSDCTAVMGTTQAIQLCTTLTFTLPAGAHAEGSHPVRVTNPGPIGCTSSGTSSIDITLPPAITDVQPATICSSGDTLTLTGSGFQAGAQVTLLGSGGTVVATAISVTVTSATQATATFESGIPANTAGTAYSVQMDAGGGCSAIWGPPQNAGVIVTPGPQIFFVDPSVVYNGIDIVATVYGTGFTGAVQAVSITEQATGTVTTLTIVPTTRANQAQVVIPAGLDPGLYDLTLQDTTACAATLVSALEVVSQTTFTLTAIQPPFGLQGESVSVQISSAAGSDFLPLPRVYLSPTNATGTTPATALGAVAIVNPQTISALVPGTLPAGTYDLIVVNADKAVGVLNAAFEVTTLAPPDISTISPGSLPNTGGVSFTIIGTDFRPGATVTLTCFDAAGQPATAPAITATNVVSATEITATVGSTSAAACVVRVTNTDNNTWDDFSALVFTNPAKDLYPAQAGPNLAAARRAPVLLGADATGSARFLHAISGDDAAGAAFASVETSPLTLLGVPTGFFTQKTTLNQARTLAAGVAMGPWMYVAGGSAAGAALASVERAYVLDPEDRPELTNIFLDFTEGAGVPPGLYYFRVSAVMGASDPFNPGGENLASDPFPVQLPSLTRGGLTVTLTWPSIPGAALYRVYRSPTAGTAAGSEEVIAEVTATTYTDAGATPISTDNPLPIGAVGNWQAIASLNTPREGAGIAWGLDPMVPDLAYLYVLGGRSSATTAHNSYEYLAVALDPNSENQLPAASWTQVTTNTIGTARWQLSAARASSRLSPVFPAGQSWVYAGSGRNAAGTSMVGDIRAAQVTAGGLLSTFQNVFVAGMNHAAYSLIVAADLVIGVGGFGGAPSVTITSGQICGSSGTTGCSSPPQVANFNTGQSMLVARYLLGGTLHGAYIYAAGGVTQLSPLTATASTEYRIW
jgi:hypothetical protein